MKINSDTSRIRAALVNSGKFSFPEAEQKLRSMSLTIVVSPDAASTTAGQAATLTAVLTGARCFREVSVSGDIHRPLLVPLPVKARSLGKAALALGAVQRLTASESRTVLIGNVTSSLSEYAIRAVWNGWSAGAVPAGHEFVSGRSDCALAGITAGALAVAQSFRAELGDVRAARVAQGLSIWTPEIGEGWFDSPGPLYSEVYLPDALWLLGLGNLGQAFLWSLSWLPYPDPYKIKLFLQDDDCVGEENWGTSVLVQRGRYGVLKTRVAEEWAEGCGFDTRRIDRRLDEHLKRKNDEPAIALAGFDSMPARRLLGHPGFEYVIDAGLGAAVKDFQKFRVTTFNTNDNPAEHFAKIEDDVDSRIAALQELRAYQEHREKSHDNGCGTVELAGQSVAVPFVSAVVGTLAVTQAIRLASGVAPYGNMSGELNDLRGVTACLGEAVQRATIGSVPAYAG